LKGEDLEAALTLTARILEKLRTEVVRRDSRLLVVFIQSQREVEELDNSLPYQTQIADLCKKLGIEHFDLAPAFKNTWYRTYYRIGWHWNSRGHEVAAGALYEYLNKYLTRSAKVVNPGATQ